MRLLRNAGRTAVAVGGALVLTAGPATSSHAATGTFTYVRADTGSIATFDDPPDHFCFFVGGGATSAYNGTNSTAILYTDSFCDPNAFVDAVQPGQTLSFGSQVPMSVQFG